MLYELIDSSWNGFQIRNCWWRTKPLSNPIHQLSTSLIYQHGGENESCLKLTSCSHYIRSLWLVLEFDMIHNILQVSWWRHQMETFSALLAICAGKSPAISEFPSQRPVTRNFDVFFDLRLNKRLSKQSWGWWFETPSHPLWRHCNDSVEFTQYIHSISTKYTFVLLCFFLKCYASVLSGFIYSYFRVPSLAGPSSSAMTLKFKNKPKWNLNRNSNFLIGENVFKNNVCETVRFFFRPQCLTSSFMADKDLCILH